MNRVKNIGKDPRLLQLRAEVIALRDQLEKTSYELEKAVSREQETREEMRQMRLIYAGYPSGDNSGFEIVYKIKVAPRRWHTGRGAPLDIQYQTAMIGFRQATARGLDLIRDVCPRLTTEATMDVEVIKTQ